MAKKESGIASVLNFEKKLAPSDGYLYGTTWAERHSKAIPLKLVEKSVRGTIANRLDKATKDDPAKLNHTVENANLQRVDTCALPMGCDTLTLKYTMKVLSGVEFPASCNDASFYSKYQEVAKGYIERTGFRELARRYVVNIANARTLWRNRLGAEKIEVCVTEMDGTEKKKTWTFDAYSFSLRDFDKTEGTEELAEKIAVTLSGKRAYLLLEIEIHALVGEGQEVYPSEELVFDKGKGDKSKILYHVDGVAAMHSQKIGNALRTIDTWYPDFVSASVGPIAIEPYGAVTTLGRAFRNPKEKMDFYTLFDRYALGEPLDDETKEHYVMAVLVRGGVFGSKE